MYCILIDAHLSDGDQMAMLDVFPLRGIDPFNSLNAKCIYSIHAFSHNHIIICVMHVSVVLIVTKNCFEDHIVHLHTCNSVTCM